MWSYQICLLTCQHLSGSAPHIPLQLVHFLFELNRFLLYNHTTCLSNLSVNTLNDSSVTGLLTYVFVCFHFMPACSSFFHKLYHNGKIYFCFTLASHNLCFRSSVAPPSSHLIPPGNNYVITVCHGSQTHVSEMKWLGMKLCQTTNYSHTQALLTFLCLFWVFWGTAL